MEEIFKQIKEDFLIQEESLSKYACKSKDAILLKKDERLKENESRTAFSKDTDRIIHSMNYTRYIDKTQVYSFIGNDHITHRVLHVQLVSKIARTIGKILNLNLDLIEAIALGHDIGHTPFGHTGESFLNDISIKENIGYFRHNAQSVRALKDIEGVNITLQTLDGILAHNGEMLQSEYRPQEKTKEQFLEEVDKAFTEENFDKKIVPMTLEGCVVRICDIIAYIGRDIEDAIVVGVIQRKDLPKEITNVLGDNNSIIVDTLIKDIIVNEFPILENKLTCIDVWTPASYKRYTNSDIGSFMSFIFPPKTLPIKISNKIKGLDNVFLATQWQQSPGGLPIAAKLGKQAIEEIKKKIS